MIHDTSLTIAIGIELAQTTTQTRVIRTTRRATDRVIQHIKQTMIPPVAVVDVCGRGIFDDERER